MRALAGPAMLLVIVGGIGLYRFSAKPDSPPREFLDLEFAGADDTGSCYSLSTVIVANMVFTPGMLQWQPEGEDAWVLSMDDVQDGGRGPAHIFQRFTFTREGELVKLTDFDASEGHNLDVEYHIDGLLQAPNQRRSTPVERCKEPGAEGYHFKKRK
jgi:hypothetical protein